MRKVVHRLYNLCGYAAAFFLAAIAGVTLLQIIARQLQIAVETTEIAGFCLAAATFLGLAYTFVNGGHVRISLVSQLLPKGSNRLIELWCCAVGILITGWSAWHMTQYTLQTLEFGDLSPGLVAMPLWIPQTGVSFGLIMLTVALVEQATLIWTGQTADYLKNVDETLSDSDG